MSDNRNLLTALVADADEVNDVASELSLPYDLVLRGLNDYDSLTRREQTVIDSAVTTFVNVTLEDTDTGRYNEITDFAEKLEHPDSMIDEGLRDLFHVMVANGDIERDQLMTFGNIFPNLTESQTKGILKAIEAGELDAQELVEAYELDDGDIFQDESEFWAVARDFYDTD